MTQLTHTTPEGVLDLLNDYFDAEPTKMELVVALANLCQAVQLTDLDVLKLDWFSKQDHEENLIKRAIELEQTLRLGAFISFKPKEDLDEDRQT